MGDKYSVSNTGIVTITNDLIVDTDVLKVDTTNNRVGVGIATPLVPLDVVGTIRSYSTLAGTGIIAQADGVNGALSMEAYGAAAGATIQTFRSRGTAAAPSAVLSGDILGVFRARAYGTATAEASGLRMLATENWTATAHGASLQVRTVANGTTAVVVSALFDQNGNVGFGTVSPSERIHVVGNALVSDNVGVGVTPVFKLDVLGDINTSTLYRVAGTQIALANLSDGSDATLKSTLTTTGDIYYASAASTPDRLAIGSAGQYLKVVGGLPAWDTLTSADLTDGVPNTRSISAGTGLSGGGDLTADRTITLADTAVTPNPYGSATQVGTFTVDAQGRLTAAANVSIQIAQSQVTNLGTDLAAKTDKSTLTTTGDIYYASAASTPARLGIGTVGQVLTVVGGLPSWATPASATGTTWTKYTFTHADAPFNTAANSDSVTIFTPAADQVIHGVRIKHGTAFSGGGSTLVNVSVGITGDAIKYASQFDVFQAVAAGIYQLSNNFGGEDGATAITLTATSDVNLSALTAGSVDVWIQTSTVP